MIRITKDDPLLFRCKVNCQKISYAASMGTIKCSDIQKIVAEFYSDFLHKLSVRGAWNHCKREQTMKSIDGQNWYGILFFKQWEEWRHRGNLG